MAEPVSLQTLLTYLTLISIPVGVFYHIMTLRNSRKNQQLQLETRQAQLFMNLYENYRDPEFRRIYGDILFRWEIKDFDEYWETATNDPKVSSELASVLSFFEGLGLLIHKELVDIDMVNELMGRTLINIWEKHEKFILEHGRRRGQVLGIPGFKPWPWFEYLYNEIKSLPREEDSAFRST